MRRWAGWWSSVVVLSVVGGRGCLCGRGLSSPAWLAQFVGSQQVGAFGLFDPVLNLVGGYLLAEVAFRTLGNALVDTAADRAVLASPFGNDGEKVRRWCPRPPCASQVVAGSNLSARRSKP